MCDENNKTPLTKLTGKEYSPLIIRRYSTDVGIAFVAIISDDDLSNIDEIVTNFVKDKTVTTIQEGRNLAGSLGETVRKAYEKAEGIAVILYLDKMMVSSLWGDFMVHTPCRLELFSLLNMMTNI